jgi:hypothetical protein
MPPLNVNRPTRLPMKSMLSPNHRALPPPNNPAAFFELLTITHQNGTRK